MREYKETQHSLLYKSNSDLSFYSAGYEECSPGYSYGPKFRSYQLIHFVLKGSGKLHINEHVFQLSAGDAFIIPSGKISYYEASRDDPWHYAWISFLGISSETYLYQIMTSLDDIYIAHGLDVEKYKRLFSGSFPWKAILPASILRRTGFFCISFPCSSKRSASVRRAGERIRRRMR